MRSGAGLIASIAGALALGGAESASAGVVVVFPLDGRGVAKDTSDHATEIVKKTLTAIKGVDIIETTVVEKKLGVHLAEQAHACEYDTFCLVEVGEIVGGERMLIGHVRRGGKEMKKDEIELKLFVLDVAKASVVDTLLWRFPNVPGALDEATRAATKKLFAPPDAKVTLRLSPPDTEVFAYGETLVVPKTQPFPYWSGTYQLHFQKDGRLPQDATVEIPPGGPTTVDIELQPDLLYVAKPKSQGSSPFDRNTRREGSGATSEEAGAAVEVQPARRSAFANPFAWTMSGIGAVGLVVGAVIANAAQGDYNDLSKQERYTGATVPSTQAIMAREDDRSHFRQGSLLTAAGVVLAAGGAMWMIIDAATRDKAPTEGTSGLRAGVIAW